MMLHRSVTLHNFMPMMMTVPDIVEARLKPGSRYLDLGFDSRGFTNIQMKRTSMPKDTSR